MLTYILLPRETRQSWTLLLHRRQSWGNQHLGTTAGSSANGQMTNAMNIMIVSWTLGTTLTWDNMIISTLVPNNWFCQHSWVPMKTAHHLRHVVGMHFATVTISPYPSSTHQIRPGHMPSKVWQAKRLELKHLRCNTGSGILMDENTMQAWPAAVHCRRSGLQGCCVISIQLNCKFKLKNWTQHNCTWAALVACK